MSIIDQALKKTQQAIEKEKSTTSQKMTYESEKIVTQTPRATIATKNYKKNILILSISLTLITLFLILFNFVPTLFTWHFHKISQSTNAMPPPPMILNGTVHVGNNRAALINHQLYHTGQLIGEFQITEIHSNSVELKNIKTSKTQKLTESLIG